MKWGKTLFGGYGYTIKNEKETFVSKSFKTPLEALLSLKRIKQNKNERT